VIDIADWEWAARIILGQADSLLAQGRWETLTDWIGLLPGEQLDAGPWLLYWRGIALTHGDPGRARADLQRALALFEARDDQTGQLLAVAAIIMALFVEEGISPNWDGWIAPLERLMAKAESYPSPAVELTVRSAFQLAAQYMRPDHPMLWPSVLRVLDLMSEETVDVNRRIQAGIVLLQYFGTTGHEAHARQLMGTLDRLIGTTGVTALNRSLASAFGGWCRHVLLAESAQALPLLGRAEAIAKEHCLVQALCNINEFQGYAQIHMCIDLPQGEAALERMAAIGFADNSNRLAGYHCSKMRSCEWRGDTRLAKHHAERCEAAARRNGPAFRVFFFPQVANAFADEGDYEHALALIREVGASLATSCYDCFDALLLLGESYLAFRKGEQLTCHQRLRESLLLAQRDPRRAAYVFWMGPQLSVIFGEALRAGIETDYVRGLIRRWAVPALDREVEAWPWPIKLYTLGRFDLQLDDRPLGFGRKAPRKAMALLKIVAATGGSGVPEHRVLDLLWPDSDGDAAYGALVATLHRLRKLLADDSAIRQSAGTIALNPQRWWVDAWAFERAMDTAGRPDATQADRLESTLALYSGDFLPQEDGVPWVVPVRERLRTKFMKAMESLAVQKEAQQRFDDALRLYRRGCDVDELAEPFYRGAMRCLHHLGRHAEARATYETLKTLLGARLNVAPSPATEKLHQSFRS
jgi:DNA-binding SARP family transcriptional activator